MAETLIVELASGISITLSMQSNISVELGLTLPGPPGPQGEQGLQGKQGVPGQDGYTPVKGVDYFDGTDGGNGLNGQDGASAYQIAVAGGFVGTESEWLASLKGLQGEPGRDGTGTGDMMAADWDPNGDGKIEIDKVNGLQTALNNKSNTGHTHGIAEVTGAIGGKNLLINSGFYANTDGWVLSTNVTRDATKKIFGAYAVKSQQTGLISDTPRGVRNNGNAYRVPCAVGDVFILSVYVYLDDYTLFDAGIVLVADLYNAAGAQIHVINTTLTPTAAHNGKWTRITQTYTVTNANAASIAMYAYTLRNGTAWFAAPKVEHGNIATDWSPAWADLLAVNPPMLTLCEDWKQPTLLNGWTEKSGRPVRYCKDALGFVHFKGQLAFAAAGDFLSIPAGYRPAEEQIFYAPTSNVEVLVKPSGTLNTNYNISAGSPVTLSQIHYRAEV